MEMDGTEKLMNEEAALSEELGSKYLTYFTDGQLFGIPIADVVQIIGMQKITEIPEFPEYVKGIIHLRGEIIPVIDVRIRLYKPVIEYSDRTCIIVTDVRGSYFGFVVEQVDEVAEIPDELITQPPRMGNDAAARYLTGVAKVKDKIVLLMDIKKLLGEQEFESLAQTAYQSEI